MLTIHFVLWSNLRNLSYVLHFFRVVNGGSSLCLLSSNVTRDST